MNNHFCEYKTNIQLYRWYVTIFENSLITNKCSALTKKKKMDKTKSWLEQSVFRPLLLLEWLWLYKYSLLNIHQKHFNSKLRNPVDLKTSIIVCYMYFNTVAQYGIEVWGSLRSSRRLTCHGGLRLIFNILYTASNIPHIIRSKNNIQCITFNCKIINYLLSKGYYSVTGLNGINR